MKSVYVGNLPYSATEDEIRNLFAEHGEVQGVKLVNDRETNRPKGFGFVQMDDAGAQAAIQALDGKPFGGRNLRVNEARERAERPPRSFDGPRGGGGRGFGGGGFGGGERRGGFGGGDRPRRSFDGPKDGGNFSDSEQF